MLDKRINEIYEVRGKVGDFGVEIEVEGANLPRNFTKFWQYHEDGSLRGESAEYVLAQPLSKKKTDEALDYIDEEFKKAKSTFRLSRRTSVHVHLNCQRMKLQEVYNLIALYSFFEDLMVLYSGPERVGNLFCLRFRDAEYLPLAIAQGIRQKNYLGFLNDNIRYAAMNLNALRNYGSVEFRSFRGSVDKKEIKCWIEVIAALKTHAVRYANPREIVEDFFNLGAETFLRKIMPAEFSTVATAFSGWEKHMEHGLLYAFEIAHASEWGTVVKDGVDPFDDRWDAYDEWVPDAVMAYCVQRGLRFAELRGRDLDLAVVTVREERRRREIVLEAGPGRLADSPPIALEDDEDYDIRILDQFAVNANAVPRTVPRIGNLNMPQWVTRMAGHNIGNGAPLWPGQGPNPAAGNYARVYQAWSRQVEAYYDWQSRHRHPFQRIVFQ